MNIEYILLINVNNTMIIATVYD